MLLTKEKIDSMLSSRLFDKSVRGYIIRINNKTFITDKRKMFWNTKSAASQALRKALEYKVQCYIKCKLLDKGYTEHEVYLSEEYRNAWKNFRKYLEDNNMIQIVEVKW